MSIRRLSPHHQATMSTRLYRLGCQTHCQSSRPLWMRCFGSSSIGSLACTSMTSSYTPGTWPNIVTTWRRSSNSSDNTVSTWISLVTRTHHPSSPHRQSHPVEHLWEHQCRTLTEPAPLGGPEGKTYVPTSQRQPLLGLSAQYSGLWTPRQHTDPLAPSSSVLVAQYDPGCLYVLE